MSISFSFIPDTIRTPAVLAEFDPSGAVRGTPARPTKVLAIGQRRTVGTVAAGVPTQMLSGAQAEGAFGVGSMLAEMVKAAKVARPNTELWAIALDDEVAGVAATSAPAISVVGTATKAGTIALMVAGVRIPVGVAVGDTATEIAAAIVAAVTAKASAPVSAALDAVNLYEVDFTCKWKGESGNSIDVRVGYYQGEAVPAGVTLTLGSMSGGTTNPDVADVIAAIGATQYNAILNPYTDAANLATLEAELAARWQSTSQNEGHAFAAARGTHGTLTTLGASRNSPHQCILGAGVSPTAPWVIAASVGMVAASEPDAPRPRQTLDIPGVLPPAEADRFTQPERDLLLHSGIATFTIDAGGVCRIERLVTTYQTNALGIPDPTYLDYETLDTLAYLRYSWRSRMAIKYPRHKLAGRGAIIPPGQPIVTPESAEAETLAWYLEEIDNGKVQDFDTFKSTLLCEVRSSDPSRLDTSMQPQLIGQLRIQAALVSWLF